MEKPFEEIMHFISESHQRDREMAAEKKGLKKGIIIAIKQFITNCPGADVMSPQEIAVIFKVDEELVKSLIPA